MVSARPFGGNRWSDSDAVYLLVRGNLVFVLQCQANGIQAVEQAAFLEIVDLEANRLTAWFGDSLPD